MDAVKRIRFCKCHSWRSLSRAIVRSVWTNNFRSVLWFRWNHEIVYHHYYFYYSQFLICFELFLSGRERIQRHQKSNWTDGDRFYLFIDLWGNFRRPGHRSRNEGDEIADISRVKQNATLVEWEIPRHYSIKYFGLFWFKFQVYSSNSNTNYVYQKL